jgi:pyridoxal phosphate enzyme (YggS family)
VSSRREELAANLADVEARIAAACAGAGRSREDVTLVAVTKTWPASDAALLRDLGVTDLGENRDQEAAPKAAEVPDVTWHFVGSLQTNKCRSVAGYADVVHAVDRLAVVEALAEGAQRAGRELVALVQVSLDGDPARGGAPVAEVPQLADHVAGAEGLRLGGVMAIAPLDADPAHAFALLARVAAQLQAAHPGATVVSAGMSGDLEQAVAAGATHLRVGSALLGPRVAPTG